MLMLCKFSSWVFVVRFCRFEPIALGSCDLLASCFAGASSYPGFKILSYLFFHNIEVVEKDKMSVKIASPFLILKIELTCGKIFNSSQTIETFILDISNTYTMITFSWTLTDY
jgi:hypothetical protein